MMAFAHWLQHVDGLQVAATRTAHRLPEKFWKPIELLTFPMVNYSRRVHVAMEQGNRV